MLLNKQYVNILVDFDNLDISNISDTQSILNHIVCRTYEECKTLNKIHPSVVNIRLYGGWYEENLLTRNAQTLSAHLQGNFPDVNDKLNCTINVELSRSLASRPSSDLLYTYRKREGLSRIHICKNVDICCPSAKAGIKFFKKIKKNKACPHCNKVSSELIWISEQKLVDVMLAMDITYFAMFEKDAILVVVSSDDDFIPAIFQVNDFGKTVIHMHTRSGYKIRPEYRSIAPNGNYIEINFMEKS